MAETNIFHALGLHMHQPPGNLRLLIDANPWEAEQIILCYERAVRYLEQFRDVARVHVGFSGVLLEQFLDPDIVDRYRHILDIPRMLERYRDCSNLELIGMGYYHPIFPIIPREDWLEQLERGRAVMERVFGRAPRGFWPPEMAFTMEMIPALIQSGYQYVVVDGEHVRPHDGFNDPLRPYVACHGGFCITLVPQDRELSQAQEGGLDADWLDGKLRARVAQSPRPSESRLFTSWSDGENGGWLRQTHEPSGFFGRFFAPYMDRCRAGAFPARPVCLSEYLSDLGALPQASVQTGSWNVGCGSGDEVSRWSGSPAQRQAVAEVQRLSRRYWALCRDHPGVYQVAGDAMVKARHLILEAETSCFLYWGDAWIPHLYARTIPAEAALDQADEAVRHASPPSGAKGSAGASDIRGVADPPDPESDPLGLDSETTS
jgi:4-alpha-glucanotransferase